ncbi:RabGAP/TBC [Pleurostoma richardsiae]|uniref:GTPase-activating protein GYP5 n=1 Tax=Pleurostoma richardsiae TaxID=41990 RepID=A0AA38R836_9PEZI|nr:RabGAP/TBC [Pleurostoma richardsiae]
MSQHEEPVSPETKDSRASSPVNSDKETDTFEDAQDSASVRSLTKRTKSQDQGEQSTPTTPQDDIPATSEVPVSPEENIGANGELDHEGKQGARRLSQTSSGELDNVNLDDDANAQEAKEEKPPVKKDQSRTISLSSMTSALPSMPWSPGAHDPPQKSPVPPSSSQSSHAPATSRKLTGPFAWLSRNSTKEPTSTSPPAVSPRRNTASSVATLTSNPEMMLSKLEEEGESNGTNGPARNSLKDRFKLMRMREEASANILPEGEEANVMGKGEGGATGLGVLSPTGAIYEDKDGSLAVQPPPSPLPQSPNPSLAPGTAAGVSAGPSAIANQPVDWDLWQSVVYEGPAAVAKTSPEELNKAIATGIPNAIRGVVWQVLAQSKNEELEVVYRELVARGTDKDKDRQSNSSLSTASNSNLSIHKEPSSSAASVHSDHSAVNGTSSPTEKDSDSIHKAQAAAAAERKKKQKEDAAMLQKLEKTIRRDLGTRTSFSKFAAAQGLQEGLFGVCKAYALFDEGVGYAQGMNFLVMPILFNMPEEEAFCLLVRLMNQYHLRDLFIQDMPGLHMHLYQFERLLEDFEPALYCHLHRKGISPHLYATQWFLTLFAYRFPLQLVLRIYDLILSEGLSAILKFGIVLMQKNASTLLGMSDMAQLTTFLKDRLFDVYIDASPSAGSILENGFFGSSSSSIDKEVYRADELIRDACEVKITPEVLKLYRAEWEEKTKAEKDREQELENLRSSNASYAIQVRKLEERIEAVDREQADLATELVHTKVQNEELKDENESLKGQVRELRIVIEKQPAELEEAWKLEQEDLMKRNAKVHEENQRLEKELADLEDQLVQTKLQYAEVNSAHETLSRKWSELKKQFV